MQSPLPSGPRSRCREPHHNTTQPGMAPFSPLLRGPPLFFPLFPTVVLPPSFLLFPLVHKHSHLGSLPPVCRQVDPPAPSGETAGRQGSGGFRGAGGGRGVGRGSSREGPGSPSLIPRLVAGFLRQSQQNQHGETCLAPVFVLLGACPRAARTPEEKNTDRATVGRPGPAIGCWQIRLGCMRRVARYARVREIRSGGSSGGDCAPREARTVTGKRKTSGHRESIVGRRAGSAQTERKTGRRRPGSGRMDACLLCTLGFEWGWGRTLGCSRVPTVHNCERDGRRYGMMIRGQLSPGANDRVTGAVRNVIDALEAGTRARGRDVKASPESPYVGAPWSKLGAETASRVARTSFPGACS